MSKFTLISHLSLLTLGAVLTGVAAEAAPKSTFDGRKGLSNTAPSPQQLAQVTSVSQLSDVQPTDWAFQALQSLVERYGCIAGYPDGTFRGNNFMTRYEFAAGLNACLDQIIAITEGGSDLDPSDLATIRRLQEEFAAELTTLRGRVDRLEARTSELEANQFSTTTKLEGEAIFALANVFDSTLDNNETVFQQRVRLNFVSSFTGQDRLLTRLQVGNSVPFGTTGTNQGLNFGPSGEGVLASQVFGDSDNSVNLESLAYSFPLGESVDVIVGATGLHFADFTPTLNPYFDDKDGGNGALSAFGQHNPIYRLGGGAGIGLNLSFGDSFQVTTGYLASEADSPSPGDGLFNGDISALAQLTYTPTPEVGFAVTYNYGYFGEGNFGFNNGGGSGFDNTNFGFTGTTFANNLGAVNAVTSHSIGAQLSWSLSPGLNVNAWGSYSDIYLRTNELDGEIWNWALGLAFPDLVLPGNLGGVIVGAQPYLGGLEDTNSFFENDIPLHLEGFYQVQVSENISITPGLVWLLNPNQDADNDSVFIGTLRGTFSF
ncbi:MAG: iron uptake porin [Cyanobacteriota bacterium]